MEIRVVILTLLILYSAIAIAPLTESKMKKVRVNIAPSIGVHDRELYVDIRLDADRTAYVGKSLDECIQHNCQSVQEALRGQGVRGSWRANVAVLDRVMDFYTKTETEEKWTEK
jgi:hypothetical protein